MPAVACQTIVSTPLIDHFLGIDHTNPSRKRGPDYRSNKRKE